MVGNWYIYQLKVKCFVDYLLIAVVILFSKLLHGDDGFAVLNRPMEKK